MWCCIAVSFGTCRLPLTSVDLARRPEPPSHGQREIRRSRSYVSCLPLGPVTNDEQDMLASRTFTEADQIRFAAVSGDRNPMHLDAVLARRTQAGVPVVHGVHMLLWASMSWRALTSRSPPIGAPNGPLQAFVAADETVAVALTKRTEASRRLDLTASGLTAAQIAVDFGAPARAAGTLSGEAVSAPAAPHDLAFEQMEGLSGRLAFARARGGRRHVPGGVRLARSAPRRRTCRQHAAGRHGVPWTAFHL